VNDEIILEIKNLKTYFYTSEGVAKAVDGVSYQLAKGEPLGVVGESGCGKSVTALSILRLIPTPPGRIVGGEILFKGENLLEFAEDGMRKI
jgi:peptide/nickel transport system ATP-binding protein/oligopeptide transport system ATP-binding protein